MRWFLVLLVFSLGCGAGPGVTPSSSPRIPLTVELVAHREWRLFSDVFPRLPSDGYPIAFSANGRVDTKNLAGVVAWRITEDGGLDLGTAHGEPTWRFTWYAEQSLMVSCPDRRDFPVPMVIALAPTTYASITERLEALGVSRCNPRGSQRATGSP